MIATILSLPDRMEAAALEVELHRELNKARIARGLQLAELRRPEFDGDGLDLAGGADWTPERVYMVEEIEEVGAELKSHLLLHRKRLQHRHIPSLISGPVDDVPSFIPIGPRNQVAGKGAGVEESAWHTGPAVGT